jgi:hypothetical protein
MQPIQRYTRLTTTDPQSGGTPILDRVAPLPDLTTPGSRIPVILGVALCLVISWLFIAAPLLAGVAELLLPIRGPTFVFDGRRIWMLLCEPTSPAPVNLPRLRPGF